MNSKQNKDEELRSREQELARREQEIRLRELEAELHQPQPPVMPTSKLEPKKRKRPKWLRKVVNVSKFLGLVLGALILVRVASVLAWYAVAAILVGAIAFVGYKLFLEDGKDDD